MTCLFDRKAFKNHRAANAELYALLESLFIPIRDERISYLDTSALSAFFSKDYCNWEAMEAEQYLLDCLVPSLDAIERIERLGDDLIIFGKDKANFSMYSQGRYVYRFNDVPTKNVKERFIPFFAEGMIDGSYCA